MYFDTISNLKNGFASSIPANGEYVVSGYYYPGDGGGGTFVWVPVSTQTPLLGDDGGIVIRTDSSSPGINSGYFKRIYSGPINVRWFGAIMGGYDPNPPIYLPEDPLIYTGYSSYTRFYSALSRNYRWRAYARR